MILLLLACGDPCSAGPNPTLELGLGRDTYQPVSDGDVAPVVQGPQGGYHIELAIETTYMNGKDPSNAAMSGRIDGDVVAQGQPWFQVECDGDVQHASGMRLFVEAIPEEIAGLSMLIEIIAEDSRGKRAEASKTLTVGDVDSSETLHGLLIERARSTPDTPAYTFLEQGEHPTTWTWGALLDRARGVEAELSSQHIEPGDRVLLAFDEGLEFLAALFGCLLHGAVAVPVHPPDPQRPERTRERIEAVVADCTPRLALGASVQLPAPAPPAPGLATLQYTSGSTAAPKGVRLAHRHFLHQLRDFDHGYDHAGGTVVSWLPATHDLGLVYGRLIGLYAGLHTVFFDPAAFVEHPRRWLEALTHYRGTHSPSPDFGFALAARRVTDTTGLDLASVRVLLNGAEPIRRESEATFVERFTPVGLNPTALTHAMGMSEATAKIVTEPIGRPARFLTVDPQALAEDRVVVSEQGSEVASNGSTQFDTVARIVDPETGEDLGEDRVGELWVAGATVADGYWGKPDHPDFHGRILGLEGVDHLRTGDLGFLHQGELYLVGRRKDVLIVRGNNHHAPDLELAVERAHPAFRRNCSVAFSLPDGGVGFVAEVRESVNPDVLFAAMRKALGSFGLTAAALWLARPRTVRKTTSGKLRRRATGQGLLDGSLATLAHWRPETTAVDAASPRTLLLSLVAARTGLTDPPHDVPFKDLGLDSVSAVEVLEELGRRLDRELGVSVLFDHPTLEALIGYLEAADEGAGTDEVDTMSEAEAEAALLAELEDL